MKKLWSALAATAMLAVSLAGCNSEVTGTSSAGSESKGGSSTGTTAAEKLTGKLVMTGSTSMEAVCSALNEAFGEKNPDLKIDLQYGGSGAAITALDNGSAQIGNLSRAVKDSENAEGKYEAITIALDGIAVVVNPDNTVADLTIEDLGGHFQKGKDQLEGFRRSGRDDCGHWPGKRLRNPGRL